MKPVFTFDEIREIEKNIIEKEGVPSIVLMENAGKNSCDALLNHFRDLVDFDIYIICGKGNNAGDGFTLARHLLIKNVPFTVLLLIDPSDLKGDALINFEILQKLTEQSTHGSEVSSQLINLFKIGEASSALMDYFKRFDKNSRLIIIDAVLGTGIKGKLDDYFSDIINTLNKLRGKFSKSKIVSLDVPSGLMSGEQTGPVVNADYTISMGTYKSELLFGDGKENSGGMEVVPIGITDKMIQKYNGSGKYFVEFEDVKKLFPRRRKTSHKYVNGKVLIIGGSKGLSGAVVMSSLSALKSGAGGVVAAIPDSISTIFNRKLYEVMTVELEETEEGTIKANQLDQIKKRLDWTDTVLLGPGISTNSETKQFVFDVIINCNKNLAVDADGLNIVASDLNVLKNRVFKNNR